MTQQKTARDRARYLLVFLVVVIISIVAPVSSLPFFQVSAVGPTIQTAGNCAMTNSGSGGNTCTATASPQPSVGQMVGWTGISQGSFNCGSATPKGVGSVTSVGGGTFCLAIATGGVFNVSVSISFAQNGGVELFLFSGITSTVTSFVANSTAAAVHGTPVQNDFFNHWITGTLFLNLQTSETSAGFGADSGGALNSYVGLNNFSVSETSGSGIPYTIYAGYSNSAPSSEQHPSKDNMDGCINAGCANGVGSAGDLIIWGAVAKPCTLAPPQVLGTAANFTAGSAAFQEATVGTLPWYCQADTIYVGGQSTNNVEGPGYTITDNISTPYVSYLFADSTGGGGFNFAAYLGYGNITAANCNGLTSCGSIRVKLTYVAATTETGIQVIVTHDISRPTQSAIGSSNSVGCNSPYCFVSPNMTMRYFMMETLCPGFSGSSVSSATHSNFVQVNNGGSFAAFTSAYINNNPWSGTTNMNMTNTNTGFAFGEAAISAINLACPGGVLGCLPIFTITTTLTFTGMVDINLQGDNNWTWLIGFFYLFLPVAVLDSLLVAGGDTVSGYVKSGAHIEGDAIVFTTLLGLLIGSIVGVMPTINALPLAFPFMFTALFILYMWKGRG